MNLILSKFIRKLRPIEFGLFIKKLLFINRIDWKLESGLYFYIDPISDFGLRIIEHGNYEPYVANILNNLLKEGDTFVDLGANEGYFSILASNLVGKNGRILAIEPQERLWNVLARNIMLNDCDNISVIPYAIGNQKTEVEITLYPSINLGASNIGNDTFRTKFYSKQKVKMRLLDDILESYGIENIKLLKIDIEGFEYFALKSAENSLKSKRIKNIIVELHPKQLQNLGISTEDVLSYVQQTGYQQIGFEKGRNNIEILFEAI